MLRITTDDKPRGKITERRNAVSGSAMPRSSKPFSKYTFFLDLKNYHKLNTLIADIKILGGSVETFLSKDVSYVVTNRPFWKQPLKLNPLDDGSLPSTPNSLSNTKSGTANDSPCNLESPKYGIVPINTVPSRASVMLEQARKSTTKGSGDVLQIAETWGVQVLQLTKFLQQVQDRIQSTVKQSSSTKEMNKTKFICEKKYLKSPYLKFEDINREYRPQYRQLKEWPLINNSTNSNRSPFGTVSSKKTNPDDGAVPKKGVLSNENSSKFQQIRPITDDTENTQPIPVSNFLEKKKTETGVKPGYCELCTTHYSDVYVHIKGKIHQKQVKEPGFYTLLDKKISNLPSILSFTRKLLRQMSSNSRKSDVFPISTESETLKENVSMPMSLPNIQKRKHNVDASQEFQKKLKPLTPLNANNAENCSAGHGPSENLPASNQFIPTPEIVRNQRISLKQSQALNVLTSKDSYSGKQICDSEGTAPIKRKVLEQLDVNSINFGKCRQTLKSQNCNQEIKMQSSKKENCDEVPKNIIRVLRSTSMRRISACQSSAKAASSPSFRSSLLVDLLNARKANSSPSDATKKKRSPLGVCRALDLGESLPTPRRKSFLNASQKLKNLVGKLDVISDAHCLETEVYPLNLNALNDMPFFECVQVLSPILTEPELGLTLEQGCLPHIPFPGCCPNQLDNLLTPEYTGFSKEFTGSTYVSHTTDSSRPSSGLNLSDEDVNKVVPVRVDEVSKVIKTKKLSGHSIVVTNFMPSTKASLFDDNESMVYSVDVGEMSNFDVPLDLSSKWQAPESFDSFKNEGLQISPSLAEFDCTSEIAEQNATKLSPSSYFNLISPPAKQRSSPASTDVAAIQKTEGSIPKFILSRLPCGEWRSRVKS